MCYWGGNPCLPPGCRESTMGSVRRIMRKIGKVLWLVFLSVFPVSSLLNDVEMEDYEKKRKP